MAIRMRRGAFANFDPSQMVAGELAVVLSGDTEVSDGKSMYVCFAAGDVKRVATWQDAAELIAEQLPEAFDLAVTSATTDAITVEQGSGASAFEISHVAKNSEGQDGLDPFSSSAGDSETLGTTTLADGTSFFVPCVSIDAYGHVSGISYRRFSMPTSGVASLTRLGKVIPDGTTIEVDANGRISAPATVDALKYRGVLASASELPSNPSKGDLYIVGGTTEFWDGSAWAELTVDLSDYVTTTALTETLEDYPTDTELETALGDYAPLASPNFTGTPTAPTAASGTNSTQIATTAFTQAEIASHAYSLPLMSPDVRGGAKLDEDGGLAVEDGSLRVAWFYYDEDEDLCQA